MKRIYINESACIGCHLCEVYCKLAHSGLNDLVQSFRSEGRSRLSSLHIEERQPVCFPVQCRHCAEPACVYACLTGALSKDSHSGIVTVDRDKCIGCWTCLLACPFGAIRQDTYERKIVKCDLCSEKDMPMCVVNCPNEALVYIEADESSH